MRDYWSEVMLLVGEIPTAQIVARLRRDQPDLCDRANLAALFAFNVKAGLQTAEALEESDPAEAHLERIKMTELLDVITGMLTPEGEDLIERQDL